MTSYDNILTCLFENCKINRDEIINSNENRKKEIIHNGIRHYNNKMETNITWDDNKEIINYQMTDSELLILAYSLKYVCVANNLEDFISVYSMFQKEVGFKDYKDQLHGRERIKQETEHKIIELITNMEDGSIMD